MLIIYINDTQHIDLYEGAVIVKDHIPPIKNFKIIGDNETETQYVDQIYNPINDIIKKENYNASHIYLVDYLNWSEPMDFPFTCVPLFFLSTCKEWQSMIINTKDCTDDQACFVMMNKHRENRILVSSWLSTHGSSINFNYTQGWDPKDADYLLLSELTRFTEFGYLKTFLEKRFISYKNNPSSNEPGSYFNDEGNISIWKHILKPEFCSSTFAIITEPSYWTKACMIDEKYLMALYGCCFPIFCGGYGIADELSNLGFDVFNDIIDHSYQYEKHPSKRVLYALELNRSILENHTVKKQDYMDRHMKNLLLVRDNFLTFTKQFNIEPIKDMYNDTSHIPQFFVVEHIFNNFLNTYTVSSS